MATSSKTKCHFEQLLSEIYARRFQENNKEMCIDSLKHQDQIKVSVNVKLAVALKNLWLQKTLID